MSETSPVLEYKTIIQDSGDPGYSTRLLIATPSTGLVRMEWVQARYGQIIPVNWSMVQMVQYMNSFITMRYQVADAQNLIVKEVIDKGFEWLLLIEHDNILPPDAFMRFDEYITSKSHPVVSGLYFTRSRPSVPLIFRGRGNGPFVDFQMGDKVYADGVPTGMLLIHAGILRKMWEESPEYQINYGVPVVTRRVFVAPNTKWYDPQTGNVNISSGTSDLEWCTRVMKERFLEKSGWTKFQEMEYPFLVDTNIFGKHISQNGEQFP